MKSLKIALFAIGLVLLGAPAIAQDAALGSNSDQFIDAVQKRDGDKATQLIQDHPTIIDAKNGKGDTALIIALRGADRDWTGFLLNKGADPNLQGANGETPLIAAARSGFDEAAEWLLGLGAKVDGTNRSGETPLIIAVQQRDAALVKILLQAGADPDRTDAVAGYSARDYAIRDARAREILKMVEAKKPKKASTAAN
jgi:ankyrin repeat protein